MSSPSGLAAPPPGATQPRRVVKPSAEAGHPPINRFRDQRRAGRDEGTKILFQDR